MKLQTTYTINAIISLLPTENGGRKNSIYNNFKPNFSFHTKRIYCGEIKLNNKEELKPGESAEVIIRLLPARTIPKNLTINDSFIISEGAKVIGTGVIKELMKQEKEYQELVNA